MTRTEARAWVKRIREDARLIDAAIRVSDEVAIAEVSLDAAGAAMMLAQAFDKAGDAR